jgi:hypothetical protein
MLWIDGGWHPRPWHGPWVGKLGPLGVRLVLIDNAAELSRRSLGQLRCGLKHSLGQLGSLLLLQWCGGWLDWLLCDGTGNRRQVSETGVAPAALRLHGGGRRAPGGVVYRRMRSSRGRTCDFLTIFGNL